MNATLTTRTEQTQSFKTGAPVRNRRVYLIIRADGRVLESFAGRGAKKMAETALRCINR